MFSPMPNRPPNSRSPRCNPAESRILAPPNDPNPVFGHLAQPFVARLRRETSPAPCRQAFIPPRKNAPPHPADFELSATSGSPRANSAGSHGAPTKRHEPASAHGFQYLYSIRRSAGSLSFTKRIVQGFAIDIRACEPYSSLQFVTLMFLGLRSEFADVNSASLRVNRYRPRCS
jgi:hypothetical protein